MFKKFFNFRYLFHNSKAGMTYVELIVVLSIFSTMSMITLFNYRDFQSMIEIKSLSNVIASKVVETQKLAMSGKLVIDTPVIVDWVPAYGVFFDKEIQNNKKFIYFVDADNSTTYNDGENLESININKDFFIKELDVSCMGEGTIIPVDNLAVTFTRPDSSAIIKSTGKCETTSVLYAIVKLSGNQEKANSNIFIYSSGRIEIK